MSGHRAQAHAGGQQASSRRRRDVAATTLLLAAVSALVFVPQLATDPEDFPAGLNLVWLALLLSAAPAAAFLLTRRRGWLLRETQLWMVTLSQLVVTVALVRLDTWLEVRRGYLMAGSLEEAMSYGLGFVLSLAVGCVLAVLVALGAGAGGRRSVPSR